MGALAWINRASNLPAVALLEALPTATMLLSPAVICLHI
jgi:hypothetical protein